MTETVTIDVEVSEDQVDMLTWALWDKYDACHSAGDNEKAGEWKELYDTVSKAANE